MFEFIITGRPESVTHSMGIPNLPNIYLIPWIVLSPDKSGNRHISG